MRQKVNKHNTKAKSHHCQKRRLSHPPHPLRTIKETEIKVQTIVTLPMIEDQAIIKESRNEDTEICFRFPAGFVMFKILVLTLAQIIMF